VDYAEARKWYEKAAAAGNEVAKANLKKLEGSNLK
jgi:TPR repeat protein